MPLIWAVLKSHSLLLHPQVLNQPLAASRLPQAYPHHPPSLASTRTPPPPHTAVPLTSAEPTRLSTSPPSHTTGPTQPKVYILREVNAYSKDYWNLQVQVLGKYVKL